ncbi:MAG: hypothetical protein KJO03_03185 [Gammaproteobacteria bacterium]|nr:hypothetical protein [Gammaproteobacteria bacterium]
MNNKRSQVLRITEFVIALPIVFLLVLLAGEFIEEYGLIVLPVGTVVYLVIAILVDKLFSRQSEQLELALERKLPLSGNKTRAMQKDG